MTAQEINYSIFNRLEGNKLEAFQKLDSMIEEVPDLDYDKELAEYREEKYGQRSKGAQ